MPGPLPDPTAVRRNEPTIPTTKIPAGGRRGPVPEPPEFVPLARAGSAWWDWAWRTPQACAWDDGQLVKVAHRASLEDDLNAISRVDEVESFLRDVANSRDFREVKALVANLAALVTNRLGILTRISDLDDKLGLSPKGRDQLRLRVVSDADYYPAAKVPAQGQDTATVTRIADRAARRGRTADAT